jgi:hypothetical protein
MSKTTTPKYRIELTCISFINKQKEIHSYVFKGRPTEKAAKEFRDGMNESFNTVNNHLRKYQSDYSKATIVEQSTGRDVVTYNPPLFETI